MGGKEGEKSWHWLSVLLFSLYQGDERGQVNSGTANLVSPFADSPPEVTHVPMCRVTQGLTVMETNRK